MEYIEFVENTERTLWGAYIPHDYFYISPIAVQPDSMFYEINRRGIVSQTPPSFEVHRRDTYIYHTLCCLIGGNGTFYVRGNRYDLQRGQGILLPACEAHAYFSHSSSPMGLVWAEFAGGDSNRIAKYVLDTGGPVFQDSHFQYASDQLTSLFLQQNIPKSKISDILYGILMDLCAEPDRIGKPHADTVQDILNFIDLHLGEHLTLTDLAARWGYNPTYFSHMFTKIAHMPFSRYLLHRRVSKACYLLSTSELSLEQIANELGFCNVYYFINRFKSVTQVTPAKYRRENYGTAFQMESNRK